jgi:hypothetical protein
VIRKLRSIRFGFDRGARLVIAPSEKFFGTSRAAINHFGEGIRKGSDFLPEKNRVKSIDYGEI